MTSAFGLISLVTVAIRHVGGQTYAHAYTWIHRLAMQRGLIMHIDATIADADSRKRYADKLELVNGIDPYEIPAEERMAR